MRNTSATRPGLIALVPTVLGDLALGVAAVLPWRANPLTVPRTDSLSVLAHDDVAPSLLYAVAVLTAVLTTVLVASRPRWAELPTGLATVLLVAAAVYTVPLRTVRAFGADSTGRSYEEEAQDYLAAGCWCAVAGAVLLLVGALILVSRRKPVG